MSRSKPSLRAKLAKARRLKNEKDIAYYTRIIELNEAKKASRRAKFKPKGKHKGKFIDPVKLSKTRRNELLINPTTSEIYIRGLLDVIGYKYEFQHIIFVNDTQFYILDFYLPEQRLCIELDGRHHYTNPKQIEHDKIRDAYLRGLRVNILRLSNAKALSLEESSLRASITEAVI